MTERIETSLFDSPLGPLLLAEANSTPLAVVFIEAPSSKPETERDREAAGSSDRTPPARVARRSGFLARRYPRARIASGSCAALRVRLERYFAGEWERIEVPEELAGSRFERAVWKQIAAIDWGRTITYGGIADRLGRPGGAQAVGRATGRNPLSILIPCHRVVGRGGALTGYSGGLERKSWLLRHEGFSIFSGCATRQQGLPFGGLGSSDL